MPEPAAPAVPAELKAKYDKVRDELRGERREVVVLFADVSGFTALSERLDAEEVSFLMQSLLNELAAVVHRYEGYVDKFIGDAIMALFGAPIAHENDAERAVLAALDMLAVLEERNVEAEHKLSIRVGLNLGEVVAAHLGSESRLQYTVMGDTVNVASRLEGAAALNSVLVSAAVHERIGGRFETEEVPPLTVKGKAEPLRAFRVHRYRAAAPRRRSASTPFVGRDRELGALEAFFQRIPTGGAGALVIEAEAGAGKSRLVEEALDRTPVRPAPFELAFSQIQLPNRHLASVELFRQLEAEGGAPDHAAGVEGAARLLFPGAGDPDGASEVDPGVARRNRWLAVAALLAERARRGPVLLRLEDAHWAGESDEEFLAFLLPTLAGRPVGVVATARPGATLAWIPTGAERLSLASLDTAAARSILGELFEALRPSARRELIRRSQGNPLYLEELARSLKSAPDASVAAVPGTVQGLLQSHIDRLEPPVRLLLQMASVLGTSMSAELLERMYGLDPQPIPFEPAFDTLVREGFVESQPEERGVRFRHALMQEVAYGGILLRLRKVLHESAAQLGEEHYADRLEAEAAFFAHHFWEAGLEEAAGTHLWNAARAAAGNFELYGAERFYERLARVLERHPDVLPASEDRSLLMSSYGTVLKERGRLEDAESWFQRLEELGEAEDRDDWIAKSLYNRGVIALFQGRLDDAAERFDRGLARVEAADDRTAGDLHSGRALIAFYRGDAEAALEEHDAALRIRERIGDRFGIVKSLINIGNVLCDLRHDFPAAQEKYERALALARENGDREMQCGLLLNLGSLAMDRGEYETALGRFDVVQEMADEVGLTFIRFLGLLDKGMCLVRLGRIQGALGALGTCLREGDDVLEPVNRVAVRLLLYEAHLTALDEAKAAEWLAEAGDLAARLEVTDQEDWLRIAEGRRRAAGGDWEAAAEAFGQAAEAAARLQHAVNERIAREHLARARARANGARADGAGADAESADAEGADGLQARSDGVAQQVPEGDGRGAVTALLRYLWADAADVQGAHEEAAAVLAEVGRQAASLGELALERAAFERRALVLSRLGDGAAEREAWAHAASAMAALEANLPAELRESFAAHPRNARLRDLREAAPPD